MANVLTSAQVATLVTPSLGTGVNITDATNATPIEVTAATHGLATGDYVMIEDVGGNTAANGMGRVTVSDGSTFTIDGSVGDGAYTSGGTVKKLAGGAANLTPGDLDDLQAALSRVKHVRGPDHDRASESAIVDIL